MIKVEITDAREFHCFRMTLQTSAGDEIEIMLHAAALVDLIHECSMRLCEWQKAASEYLICRITGLTPEEAREQGLIAPEEPQEAEPPILIMSAEEAKALGIRIEEQRKP
jgi:hypothetical protein